MVVIVQATACQMATGSEKFAEFAARPENSQLTLLQSFAMLEF